MNKAIPDFSKGNGLIPVIVQNIQTSEVLMLGYMNVDAYTKTCQTGWVYFWSRSRNALWMKGETSGNKLKAQTMVLDCDSDTILIKAKPLGTGVCHTGSMTCFTKPIEAKI